MEGGNKLFRGDVPYVQMIEGTINGGNKFYIEGKGMGNAQEGYQKGKWVCKSGKMPIPWSLLCPTLQYGFLVFAKYPNGIPNFYVQSMPEGFAYDRTLTFEDDGVVTSHHDIYWDNGQVMNKVTMSLEGFKSDSPVTNFRIGVPEPSVSTCIAKGDGGKNLVPLAFPIKDTPSEFAHAVQRTDVSVLGTPRKVTYGNTHFYRAQQEQFKDVDDKSDHICQHECLEMFDFSLLEAFNKKQ